VDAPADQLWAVLTDYDRLSERVPNLVESAVLNPGDVAAGRKPRVYQKGAQKIWGFEFGADVTLEMTERVAAADIHALEFRCVDSFFFSQFDGAWTLEDGGADDRTLVRYAVDVTPQGPVPVAALEWRIQEDVPVNVLAVRRAAEALLPARGEAWGSARARPTREPRPARRRRGEPARLLKSAAKAFLPPAVLSAARQMLGDEAPTRREERRLARAREERDGREDVFVDWYEDETMATYLKDL